MDRDTQRGGAAGHIPPVCHGEWPPIRPDHDIPKALSVVELSLSQVALDQVDMLPAGCAGAAERGARGLLRRLRGGIVLTHNAQGAQDGGQELLPSPQLLQEQLIYESHC